MSKFSCYDFEKTLLDNFEEDFVENLLDYITKIDFNKFVRGLLKNLKTTIAYIEQARVTQGNIVVDNVIKRYVDLINIQDKLDFKTFQNIIYNVPAFIPLVLLFLKTNVYLNRISSRKSFVESIHINIDKVGLLNELWCNNLSVGSFFENTYQQVFPTIKRQWQKYPEVEAKCEIFSFLYLSFEKAVFLPLKKMEDRLIMDINTLFDTYFYTSEDNTDYDFCGGPRMIPDASDKLKSIMIGNVYKPDKYKKKEEENRDYIDGYTDYNNYKFWYTRLNFIAEYLEAKRTKQSIKLKYKKLDLYEDQLKLLEKDYQFCVENQKADLLKYILKLDKFLYYFLTLHEKISNTDSIINYIAKISKKDFALKVIKNKYSYLYSKSNKRIQNKFIEFNKLTKDYHDEDSHESKSSIEISENINKFLKFYYEDNSDRYEELDDKESEDDELKEFIPKFRIFYNLFEQYLNVPTEALYQVLIEQIDSFKLKKSRYFY